MCPNLESFYIHLTSCRSTNWVLPKHFDFRRFASQRASDIREKGAICSRTVSVSHTHKHTFLQEYTQPYTHIPRIASAFIFGDWKSFRIHNKPFCHHNRSPSHSLHPITFLGVLARSLARLAARLDVSSNTNTIYSRIICACLRTHTHEHWTQYRCSDRLPINL